MGRKPRNPHSHAKNHWSLLILKVTKNPLFLTKNPFFTLSPLSTQTNFQNKSGQNPVLKIKVGENYYISTHFFLTVKGVIFIRCLNILYLLPPSKCTRNLCNIYSLAHTNIVQFPDPISMLFGRPINVFHMISHFANTDV